MTYDEPTEREYKFIIIWFTVLGLSTGLITGVLLPYPVVLTIGVIVNFVCYFLLFIGWILDRDRRERD